MPHYREKQNLKSTEYKERVENKEDEEDKQDGKDL